MSYQDEIFEQGVVNRREVLGIELAGAETPAGAFVKDFREFAVGWCWGAGWSRTELDRRSRSMITLGMLVALRSLGEIKLHVKGALRNGLTPEEIREVVLHATIYAGVPAGGAAMQAVVEALEAEGAIKGKAA